MSVIVTTKIKKNFGGQGDFIFDNEADAEIFKTMVDPVRELSTGRLRFYKKDGGGLISLAQLLGIPPYTRRKLDSLEYDYRRSAFDIKESSEPNSTIDLIDELSRAPSNPEQYKIASLMVAISAEIVDLDNSMNKIKQRILEDNKILNTQSLLKSKLKEALDLLFEFEGSLPKLNEQN
jgi:hypothetical protein